MRRKEFRFPVTTLAGSTLKNIRALEAGHKVEPRFRFKYAVSLAVAGIFEVFNLSERIFCQKRIREYHHDTSPVFIIGFWRSGTTLLHNLLCQDPNAAYTTTFQTVFPNVVLTQSWWLKPLVNIFLPANRPYDNISMDMDFPQEEDFGLMNLQPTTIYKFFIYPGDFNRIVDEELKTGNMPPDKVTLWKEAYRSMIVKAIFNTGGKRYISKNPCHMTRIGLLLEMFPDGKFIFIHRHPHKVIESLYHFILSIFPGVQLQDVPDSYNRSAVVNLYQRSMDTYFADRGLIPSGNLIEVNLDEFQLDIHGNLKAIYQQFGLGDYTKVSGHIDAFLRRNPAPERVANPPTTETIQLIGERASHIMKELGYD